MAGVIMEFQNNKEETLKVLESVYESSHLMFMRIEMTRFSVPLSKAKIAAKYCLQNSKGKYF